MHSYAFTSRTVRYWFFDSRARFSTLASNSRLSIIDSYAFSCLYLTLRYSAEFFHGRACMLLAMLSASIPASTIVGIVGMMTMLSHFCMYETCILTFITCVWVCAHFHYACYYYCRLSMVDRYALSCLYRAVLTSVTYVRVCILLCMRASYYCRLLYTSTYSYVCKLPYVAIVPIYITY